MSPTTRQQDEVYPMLQQQMDLWCWAAVAQSVHRVFDRTSTLSQCRIAQAVTGLDCCNSQQWQCNQVRALEDALREVGHYRRDYRWPLPFNYVRQSLDADHPICVRSEWRGGGGHFVVICGYTISASGEEWLTIADPRRIGSGTGTAPARITYCRYDDFLVAYRGLGEWTDTYLVQRVGE